MDHFSYRNGALHAEDVAVAAAVRAFGSPLYVYSRATIERHFDVFAAAFAPRAVHIAYAVKANPNLAVLKVLAKRGAGADVVSAGEAKRAIQAGIAPANIVFSGVGKSEDELNYALDAGVGQVNIESTPEMDRLQRLAAARRQAISLGFRVNPDVGAGGHAKITTGHAATKFGIPIQEALGLYARAQADPYLQPRALACHIGSQIMDLSPIRDVVGRMASYVRAARGQGLDVRILDLGGGLGVPYHGDMRPPPPDAYAEAVLTGLGDLDVELGFEPGRMIVGNAGIMIATVEYLKQSETRDFVVVDAAMNDLMRPALYDAFHDIIPVREPAPEAAQRPYDVVGPVCETTDIFAEQRLLPALVEGDLIAFRTAGAYGASMSNSYNSRALIAEVMVDGDRMALIRRRVPIEELMAYESTPDWL